MGVTINGKTKEPTIAFSQEPPFLLCAKCFNRIPFISLVRTGTVIQVHIKCLKCASSYGMKLDTYLSLLKQQNALTKHCTFTPSHTSIISTIFCPHCNKWLCKACSDSHQSSAETARHCLLPKAVLLDYNCPLHSSEPLTSFCGDCNSSICIKCIEQSHSGHQTSPFDAIAKDVRRIDMKANTQLINYFREANKKRKETLINLLNSKIEQLNQMKQDIEVAYADNDTANQSMLELLTSMKNSQEMLKESISYEALVNIKVNWSINKTEAMIDDSSVEGNCIDFIKYLNTNYIIQAVAESKSPIPFESLKINGSIPKQMNESNYKIELTNDIKLVPTIEAGHHEEEGKKKNVKAPEVKQDELKLDEEKQVGTKPDEVKEKVKQDIRNDMKEVVQEKEIQCVKTIEAHKDGISSMIQLKDGRLATCSYDKTIKIWNLTQYTCDMTLDRHTDEVYALVQLKDSRLCSGSRDASIIFWDSSSFKAVNTLTAHLNSIVALIQLENSLLVSGSADKTIKVWNTSTFECLYTLREHTDTVYCFTQLKDGRLVSGSNDTTIRLWDVSITCIGTLRQHTDFVNCLLQLKNKRLASCSSDKTIIIWDLEQMKQIATFNNSPSIIFTIRELKKGTLIAGTKNCILLINIATVETTKTIEEHKNGIRSIILMKDGQIASCSDDSTVKIWSI